MAAAADLTAEVVVDVPSEHAEGPLWDVVEQRLIWVDQHRGLVLAPPEEAGGQPVRLADIGAQVGALTPASDGGFAVAGGDGFLLLRRDGSLTPIASALPDDGVERRMNDAKAAPDGTLWAGSMALDAREGASSLYRLRHGEVTEMLSGLTIANGTVWSPDGSAMWFIDTPTNVVRRFTFDGDGRPVDPEVAVRIDDEVGHPDGMTIDAEGMLWVAVWGGGAVHRYSPAGELLQRVLVAAPQVSSCCFGGDDLRTLFITTSREGYGDAELAEHPTAGAIFAARTDVEGLPADAYVLGG